MADSDKATKVQESLWLVDYTCLTGLFQGVLFPGIHPYEKHWRVILHVPVKLNDIPCSLILGIVKIFHDVNVHKDAPKKSDSTILLCIFLQQKSWMS